MVAGSNKPRFFRQICRCSLLLEALTLVVLSIPLIAQSASEANDWPMYGRDPGSSRFSPLDQINRENVSQLKRAWTYHTGETGRGWETTPIVVGSVLYLSTHNQNIVALDSE